MVHFWSHAPIGQNVRGMQIPEYRQGAEKVHFRRRCAFLYVVGRGGGGGGAHHEWSYTENTRGRAFYEAARDGNKGCERREKREEKGRRAGRSRTSMRRAQKARALSGRAGIPIYIDNEAHERCVLFYSNTRASSCKNVARNTGLYFIAIG